MPFDASPIRAASVSSASVNTASFSSASVCSASVNTATVSAPAINATRIRVWIGIGVDLVGLTKQLVAIRTGLLVRRVLRFGLLRKALRVNGALLRFGCLPVSLSGLAVGLGGLLIGLGPRRVGVGGRFGCCRFPLANLQVVILCLLAQLSGALALGGGGVLPRCHHY